MLPQCTSDTKLQKGTFQHTALYKNCKQGAHTPTHWHTTPPHNNSITTTHQQRVQYRGLWYDSCKFSKKNTKQRANNLNRPHCNTDLKCFRMFSVPQVPAWGHSDASSCIVGQRVPLDVTVEELFDFVWKVLGRGSGSLVLSEEV